ncbi:MAG: hypothetical protein LBP88_00175 [Treponema sp.]|jgi:hypothetical protein|nr:hypothetical protein [Treponema sp.]
MTNRHIGSILRNMNLIAIGLVPVRASLGTGCIDGYQHITRSPQGIERNPLKITVSQMMLEMPTRYFFSNDIPIRLYSV